MSSLDWILKTDLKGDRLELTAYYNQFKEHHEVECPRCSKNVLVGNQVEQNYTQFKTHYKSNNCKKQMKQNAHRSTIPGTSVVQVSLLFELYLYIPLSRFYKVGPSALPPLPPLPLQVPIYTNSPSNEVTHGVCQIFHSSLIVLS